MKSPIQSRSPAQTQSPVQIRSPIRTRSSSNEVQHGPIKLLKETPAKNTGGAASNETVQKTFMEMIGWVDRGININHDQEVLPKEVGSILACANKHRHPPNISSVGDGYYTQEELDKSVAIALENKHSNVSTACGCIAHQNVQTFGNDYTQKDLYELMRIPEIMNNDQGKKFIIALVNIILFYTDLNRQYSIFATEQGTQYSVNFVLSDTITSETQSFRGWPDFCITEKTMGAGVLLVSVGEMESNKDCLSQLGIYGVGQFNSQQNKKKKISLCSCIQEKTGECSSVFH